MVINSYPRFWRQDPATLPRPEKGKRAPVLRKVALFDLATIQACILSGELDEELVEVVTRDCQMDLQRLRWTSRSLLDFILTLRPYELGKDHDFINAQWCHGSAGDLYPCDAYEARFDTKQMKRDPRGASIYVKFSIPEDGECLLITVSAHD